MAAVSVKLPSLVVTVIVTVPSAIAVTEPFAATVATDGLLDDQATELLVAFVGETVAVNNCEEPAIIVVEVGVTLTPETATGAASTFIVEVAVKLPSAVVTVIVAIPTDMPVTNPFVLTEATLEDQLTEVSSAFNGKTVAVSNCVAPSNKVVVVGETVTPVTSTGTASTVISDTSVKSPSLVVTVIVVIPAPTAVTIPFVFTVATAVLLEDQVTELQNLE